MEISDVERLVELLQEAPVGELTLRQGGQRVTIRKAASTGARTEVATVADEEYEDPAYYAADPVEERQLVTAPLVGVFGHVKPVVGLNARVTEGQVVGVIEAMKIITEIKAPCTGVVTDLLIEDGHPVEYGQVLFEIRPA